MHTSDHRGMEIRDFTGALGRLLEKKMKKKNMMTKIRVLRMSVFSWEETKVLMAQ